MAEDRWVVRWSAGLPGSGGELILRLSEKLNTSPETVELLSTEDARALAVDLSRDAVLSQFEIWAEPTRRQ